MLRIQLPSNHVTVGEGVPVCWVCSGSPERSPEILKWRKCGGDPARSANWIIIPHAYVAMTSFANSANSLNRSTYERNGNVNVSRGHLIHLRDIT